MRLIRCDKSSGDVGEKIRINAGAALSGALAKEIVRVFSHREARKSGHFREVFELFAD